MPPSPSPSYHCLDPSQLCHHKICKLALLLISLFLFLIRTVYLTRMLMLHFFSTTDALVIVKRNATLISRPCILFWLHKAKIQETLNVAAPPSRMIFFDKYNAGSWWRWAVLISLDLSRFPTYEQIAYQNDKAGSLEYHRSWWVGGTISVVHPCLLCNCNLWNVLKGDGVDGGGDMVVVGEVLVC